MKSPLLASALILTAATLGAQDHDPAGPVRVVDQPKYEAPDGSVSEIRKGQPSALVGALHLIPSAGRFALTFVIDDAVECVGPHSVEHRTDADTLTVTLFDNAPALCPGMVTLREYTLTVANLKPRTYLLRLYREGRDGRGGKASGVAPWLTVNVHAR